MWPTVSAWLRTHEMSWPVTVQARLSGRRGMLRDAGKVWGDRDVRLGTEGPLMLSTTSE